MARLAAGVRKRSDGTFEKRFTVDGKRYSSYGKTAKECEKKERELRQQIEAGLYVENRNLTLNQFYEEWKKSRVGVVKERTEISVDITYQTHFRDTLGKKKIRDIEKREIVQLQQELAKKLKPTSVNQYMTKLKSLLAAAVEEGIIAKNPAAGVKPLRTDGCTKASETIHRALTREEQEAFLQEAESEWLYPFFLFSLCTGMRILEIGALEWGDLDYINNVIHVSKTLSRRNGYYEVTTPKSKTSIRDIPINEPIRQAIKLQRDNMLMVFGSSSLKMSERVFLSLRKKQLDSAVAKQTIEKILKRLDKKGVCIEPFAHHAFRDTFATRYLEEGGNMQTLKTLLGHASLAMTADLYAHVLPTTKRQEMELVQNAFTRAAGG